MEQKICLKCKNPLKGRQVHYCSNQCKLTHKAGIEKRTKKKEKQDDTKILVSKIDGKNFSDLHNYSGALTRYLKTLNIDVEDVFQYFEIRDKIVKETYKCKYCDWKTVDLKNKSGQITVHLKNKHSVTPSQHLISYPEDNDMWVYSPSKEIRDFILSKDTNSFIECQECNKKFKRLTITHMKFHNMTLDQYRRKYSINKLSSNNVLSGMKESYHKNIDNINANIKSSKMQDDLCNWLSDQNIEIIKNDRSIISPYELDIYLPEYKVAIEVNGLYWHSEYGGKKTKDYHLAKTEMCESKGVQLIHIFEDDWYIKQDIILSKLSSIINQEKSKAYARKCSIEEIDKKIKTQFLSKYHIQGSDKSNINIGLYYQGDIVAVMTFGKLRRSLGQSSVEGHYELCRYATKIKVVGGASKCLSYFIKLYNPSKIITYADRRWTSSIKNTMYDKIGFKNVGCTKPGYWYTKDYSKKIHRFNFNKKRLVEEFKLDITKTERQIMYELGYDKIWDCGNIKYEMNLQNNPDIYIKQ
jgi:very-short-patch-repair endonuclease